MQTAKLVSLALIMLIVDIVWLGYISNYFTDYNQTINKVQKSPLKPRYLGGFIAYILMFIGFLVFVYPNVKDSINPLKDSLYYGGLYGLTVYGIYNGTNYFTFEDWDKKTVLVDSLWGATLYTSIAFISNKIN